MYTNFKAAEVGTVYQRSKLSEIAIGTHKNIRKYQGEKWRLLEKGWALPIILKLLTIKKKLKQEN